MKLIFSVYLHIWQNADMTKNDDRTGAEQTAVQSEPAALLASELRGVVGRLRRRMRDQTGPRDLNSSQVEVLLRLDREGPATTSSLARAEGMRPQSMSAALAPMLARGLVAGAPDPADGRQTILTLSDAGRGWLDQKRALRQDWLTRKVRSDLSATEQQALMAAIDLMKRLADN